MSLMPDILKKHLRKANIESKILKLADNIKIVVLPLGGRVLGLFNTKTSENFFWTNPVLSDPEKVNSIVKNKQWLNPGGDRTWISPEKDFFFPDYPEMKDYVQPQQLESNSYKLSLTNNIATLTNHFDIKNYALNKNFQIKITKAVSPVPNPLRYENTGDIEFAGYSLKTQFEITKPLKNKELLGAWSILQLPHNGTMVISTFSKTKPVCYFGNIPKSHIKAKNTGIEYSMKAKGIQKIGVNVLYCTGRIGYTYKLKNKFCLIVRYFNVNPSAEYIDTPWQGYKANRKPVYAVQACNVNSNIGSFSEMEYHSPAITNNSYCDVSQLWAFRGTLKTNKYYKKISNLLIKP